MGDGYHGEVRKGESSCCLEKLDTLASKKGEMKRLGLDG